MCLYSEDFEAKLKNASDDKAKIRVLMEWSKQLEGLQDYARSLNVLGKVPKWFKHVESTRLQKEYLQQYRRIYKKFNPIVQQEYKKADRVVQKMDLHKKLSSWYRPVQRRNFQPLSMSHLNGFNTMLSIPKLDSAYLMPNDSYIITDINFDVGNYDESESLGLNQDFSVDSTIWRALVEINMPMSYAFSINKDLPVDIKIGIPVLAWSNKPSFTVDNNGLATQLLKGESGSTALGDIYIDMKIALYSNQEHVVSTSFRIKTPTGDEEELTGTGGLDLGVSLLYSGTKEKHRWNANLGYINTGDADVFSNVNEIELNDILHFSADYGYNIYKKNYLMFGLDYHENGFQDYTNLDILEDSPFSMGFGYALNYKKYRTYFGYKKGLNSAALNNQFLISLRMNY